jgi:DNA-binding transcriptional regulator YdaS (Cro superfamily)
MFSQKFEINLDKAELSPSITVLIGKINERWMSTQVHVALLKVCSPKVEFAISGQVTTEALNPCDWIR